MSNPYTPVEVENYNLNPPPDDGTITATNEIKWSSHKEKLSDPLKTAIEDIDANVTSALEALAGGIVSVNDNYVVTESDQGKTIVVTVAEKTITTPSAAVVGEGFKFGLVNASTGSITVDGSGAQTIDGSANIVIPTLRGLDLDTNGTNWFSKGKGWGDSIFTDIASAATIDLNTILSLGANITGSTGPTTSLGTGVNLVRIIRCASTPTFNYNATSLITPTLANYTATAGQILLATSDSSGNWTLIDFRNVAKKADQQSFTGSGTWTKPSGFSAKAYVLIEAWGAGGGGGRNTAASTVSGAGGGSYKTRRILLSALGSTETVTIGAGGTGRTGSAGSGTAGGNTTFGSFLTAYGGGPGQNNGTGGGGGTFFAQGVTGSGDGDFFTGGNGGPGSGTGVGGQSVYGGGGGGGGGTSGTNAGGVSQFGGSGGTGGGTATAGTQPGGGGGGGVNGNGGDGGAGKCVVTIFDGA